MRNSKIGLVLMLAVMTNGLAESPPAPPSNPEKLQLTADLVLAQEFCKMRQRESFAIRDVLRPGKAVCSTIEAALAKVFARVNRIEVLPPADSRVGQITLIPRFVQVQTTSPMMPTTNRKLVILIEWTVLDRSGKTVWLETIQASSQHKAGWTSATKNLVEKAAENFANQSALEFSRSPEIRKLARAATGNPSLRGDL